MFGKVKKWLGIEGVKLELLIPEELSADDKQFTGKMRFSSMNEQTVTSIKVVMIERFSRGRNDDKRTDEYVLGETSIEQPFLVPSEESVEVDFTLPYDMMKSEMDRLEDKNLVLGGLVKAAKWFRNVSSEFRIVAEANVKGTALNPFDRKTIIIK